MFSRAFFFRPWWGARLESMTGPLRRSPKYCSRYSSARSEKNTIRSFWPFPITFTYPACKSRLPKSILTTSDTRHPVAKNSSSTALSRILVPQAIRIFSISLGLSASLISATYLIGSTVAIGLRLIYPRSCRNAKKELAMRRLWSFVLALIWRTCS